MKRLTHRLFGHSGTLGFAEVGERRIVYCVCGLWWWLEDYFGEP
jgi:hypothetical protein